jgi:hypothetical protein
VKALVTVKQESGALVLALEGISWGPRWVPLCLWASTSSPIKYGQLQMISAFLCRPWGEHLRLCSGSKPG